MFYDNNIAFLSDYVYNYCFFPKLILVIINILENIITNTNPVNDTMLVILYTALPNKLAPKPVPSNNAASAGVSNELFNKARKVLPKRQ